MCAAYPIAQVVLEIKITAEMCWCVSLQKIQ